MFPSSITQTLRWHHHHLQGSNGQNNSFWKHIFEPCDDYNACVALRNDCQMWPCIKTFFPLCHLLYIIDFFTWQKWACACTTF
jgi:hypothetical protein